MMDEYWDADTVFFVFEDDFRFDNDPPVPVSHMDAYAQETMSTGSTSAFTPRNVEVSKSQQRVKGQWFEIPTRTPAEGGRRRIDDLMHYMIQAYQKGCGNIVWMSWQPGEAGGKPKRTFAPSSGSLLWGITPAGARSICDAMKRGDVPPGHIDIQLKHWLCRVCHDVKACCIVPPIGNYRTAVSGTESATKKQKQDWVREACWNDSWCCPGTTKSEDPQKRSKFLVWLTAKGPPSYHHELRDPEADPDLKWHTYELRPEPLGEPAASEDEDKPEPDAEPEGLQDQGPPLYTSAKSKARGPPAAAASSQPMRSAAAASSSSGILPLPAEPDDTTEAVTNRAYPFKRARRVARTQRLHDSHPNWTEDAAEAGSPLSYHMFSY